MDSSQIVWSHATNSQSELEKALSAESPVNFIEADVILSEAEGSEPIMAHPPATTSDLTFKDFVEKILTAQTAFKAMKAAAASGSGLGIKLDFKQPEAVGHCINHIKERLAHFESTPLWLNADIWQGPGGAPSPFRDVDFLADCLSLLKLKPITLSLGWTTSGNETPYLREHVETAITSLVRLGVLKELADPASNASSHGATQSECAAENSDSSSAKTSGPQCSVGDYVVCLHGGQWVPGRVVCVNNTREPPEEWADDDTVNVLLAKGKNNHAIGLHPHEVKVLPALKEGDRVQAVQGGALWGKTAFVPGRVVKVRKNNLFDVEFEDGEVEQLMDRSFIRLDNSTEDGDDSSGTKEVAQTDGFGRFSAVCAITFPVKASLASIVEGNLWQDLLAACDDVSLTVWGAAGLKEQAWIGSFVNKFPGRVYVDVQQM